MWIKRNKMYLNKNNEHVYGRDFYICHCTFIVTVVKRTITKYKDISMINLNDKNDAAKQLLKFYH